MDLCLAAELRPVHGYPSGGGNRTIWMWRVCRQRIERRKLRRGGVDGRGRDGDRLSWWEDNVANLTLGTEPNAPLAYALVLEHHHPILSEIGDPGGRLEIDRD